MPDDEPQWLTSTERLGWPEPSRLTRLVPWETQAELRYELEPDAPTATCHLQLATDEPALCGHPWELLTEVPGNPPFAAVADELRCDACEEAADRRQGPPSG